MSSEASAVLGQNRGTVISGDFDEFMENGGAAKIIEMIAGKLLKNEPVYQGGDPADQDKALKELNAALTSKGPEWLGEYITSSGRGHIGRADDVSYGMAFGAEWYDIINGKSQLVRIKSINAIHWDSLIGALPSLRNLMMGRQPLDLVDKSFDEFVREKTQGIRNQALSHFVRRGTEVEAFVNSVEGFLKDITAFALLSPLPFLPQTEEISNHGILYKVREKSFAPDAKDPFNPRDVWAVIIERVKDMIDDVTKDKDAPKDFPYDSAYWEAQKKDVLEGRKDGKTVLRDLLQVTNLDYPEAEFFRKFPAFNGIDKYLCEGVKKFLQNGLKLESWVVGLDMKGIEKEATEYGLALSEIAHDWIDDTSRVVGELEKVFFNGTSWSTLSILEPEMRKALEEPLSPAQRAAGFVTNKLEGGYTTLFKAFLLSQVIPGFSLGTSKAAVSQKLSLQEVLEKNLWATIRTNPGSAPYGRALKDLVNTEVISFEDLKLTLSKNRMNELLRPMFDTFYGLLNVEEADRDSDAWKDELPESVGKLSITDVLDVLSSKEFLGSMMQTVLSEAIKDKDIYQVLLPQLNHVTPQDIRGNLDGKAKEVSDYATNALNSLKLDSSLLSTKTVKIAGEDVLISGIGADGIARAAVDFIKSKNGNLFADVDLNTLTAEAYVQRVANDHLNIQGLVQTNKDLAPLWDSFTTFTGVTNQVKGLLDGVVEEVNQAALNRVKAATDQLQGFLSPASTASKSVLPALLRKTIGMTNDQWAILLRVNASTSAAKVGDLEKVLKSIYNDQSDMTIENGLIVVKSKVNPGIEERYNETFEKQ